MPPFMYLPYAFPYALLWMRERVLVVALWVWLKVTYLGPTLALPHAMPSAYHQGSGGGERRPHPTLSRSTATLGHPKAPTKGRVTYARPLHVERRGALPPVPHRRREAARWSARCLSLSPHCTREGHSASLSH